MTLIPVKEIAWRHYQKHGISKYLLQLLFNVWSTLNEHVIANYLYCIVKASTTFTKTRSTLSGSLIDFLSLYTKRHTASLQSHPSLYALACHIGHNWNKALCWWQHSGQIQSGCSMRQHNRLQQGFYMKVDVTWNNITDCNKVCKWKLVW